MFTTSLLSLLALSLSAQRISALPTVEEAPAYQGAATFKQPLDSRDIGYEGAATFKGSVALDPRAAVCNADNCLRAVRATTSNFQPASSFCQSFLSTTPVTTITSYTTVISIPTVPTVTSVVGTTTSTIGIQCTSTSTSTSYVTSTSTDVQNVATTVFVKRAAPSPLSVIISSACTSAGGNAQSARISSACSCFLAGSASTSTVYSTLTATSTGATPLAVTSTSSFLATETVSVCSAYETSVIVATLSVTATSLVTSTSTTTSTTTIPQATNSCVLKSNPPAGSFCGVRGLIGYGSFPGNSFISDLFTPDVTNGPGCALACAKVPACKAFYVGPNSFCELQSMSTTDVHFAPDAGSWYDGYDPACFNCI